MIKRYILMSLFMLLSFSVYADTDYIKMEVPAFTVDIDIGSTELEADLRFSYAAIYKQDLKLETTAVGVIYTGFELHGRTLPSYNAITAVRLTWETAWRS